MLFSNSIKSLTEFYLIITKQGEIIYKDDRKTKEFLEEFFSSHLKEIVKKLNEEALNYQFYHGNFKIKVKPLLRPADYILITINNIESTEFYNHLLEVNNIPAYKIENNKIVESNKAYEKYFPDKKSEFNFLNKSISAEHNLENHPTFFNNYFIKADNSYYGILIPKILQLNQLLNEIPFGCAILNKNLEVIDANNKFYEITNTSKNINDQLNKKIDIGNNKNLILDLEFSNGNYIRVYTINFEDIFICFFIDLNDLKSLREKLHHSQKIESLGQLSGGIAHDFNNILTAIHGFAEVLISDMDINNKYYYDINQIKVSAEMGRKLVKKIMAFARNQTLKIENFDVNDVIILLKQLLERLIPENIKFSFDLAPNLKAIKADKLELEQTIINLIINARDALLSGGSITIKTENTLIDGKKVVLENSVNQETILKGEYVKICISDNGKGIDEKILPRIFDPFFSTKDVNKGTGLGLSTAYGIIKQFGGYIDVESDSNKGTKFFLFIPVSYEKLDENNSGEESFKITEKNKLKKNKILLVEDDKMVKQFLNKALQKHNLKFIDSNSPSSALKIFNDNKNSITLVISDVIMPEMSGPEMIELMRKNNPDLKVIFISGYTRDKLKLDEDNKNSFFLEKPFKIHDLISLINKICD